jgi:hypothetical protein
MPCVVPRVVVCAFGIEFESLRPRTTGRSRRRDLSFNRSRIRRSCPVDPMRGSCTQDGLRSRLEFSRFPGGGHHAAHMKRGSADAARAVGVEPGDRAVTPATCPPERRTTAHLRHPHILQLFDSGEAASSLFYTLPYVDGWSACGERLIKAAMILRSVRQAGHLGLRNRVPRWRCSL